MYSLPEVLQQIVPIAHEAGAKLMDWHGRLAAPDVTSKSAQRDLVTSADLAAEKIIVERLRAAFPNDGMFAEESGTSDLDADHIWYIDPLDGTTNFVHSLPMFCVSIARVTAGQPDVAVVYLPRLEETFTASTGAGCALNGAKVKVSNSTHLQQSLLATGFPYRRHLLAENNLENFNRLFLTQQGIRRMGSAAADLAYIACGRLDAFWELHLGPYDVAAGGLLVREAGGVVDTIESGGDWIHGKSIIAGSATLVQQMRDVLLKDRAPGYPPLGDREQAGV
ncbi:MAG: inositol monophosphatase [Planctomycetes bacterium]|nr:inositol monophosphatase [Planctomycetota bacterium]